jgi:indolepyruvate ferredoxin oxidoreductase alpha subunit
MKKVLMTGNEALARGAWEAGVRFASAYPGTPSTEILENLFEYKEVYANWAVNEKTCFEAAAGASLGGVRALAAMKHVGVNVAADPLFTFAYIGVNAGMVLVSADEPGMYSSQNEQDNRNYAYFAKVPMLEPSDSGECLEMMKAAFDISEQFDTPVIIRITTRVAHSKSVVSLDPKPHLPVLSPKPYVKNVQKNLPIPSVSAQLRVNLEERMARLSQFSEDTPFNYVENGGDIGIIASGMCVNYAKEVFGDNATYLKLGFTNPLPDKLLDEFYRQGFSEVYVIEENDPYLEHWVLRRGYSFKTVRPSYGEKTPDVLRSAIAGHPSKAGESIPPRPPVLCAGCPHRGFLVELGKRKDTIVAGDIGCYTLGFAPPFNAVDFAICMGAAFSSAYGMAKALETTGDNRRVVGIMGDSTFFHTGINSLIEVLNNKSNVVCCILDNRVTGMTGQQNNPGEEIDIAGICRALGAKNVAVVNPNDLDAVRQALDDAYNRNEVSVIITRWPCVLKTMGEKDLLEFGDDLFKNKFVVKADVCIGCKVCLDVGCPSVVVGSAGGISAVDTEEKVATITHGCVGCGVCAKVCPVKAIRLGGEL